MRMLPRAPALSAVLVMLVTAATPLAAAQTDAPEEPVEEFDLMDFFPLACRDVLEEDATAYGKGMPILVRMNGQDVLTVDPPAAEAYQAGPGKAGDRVGAIDINIPDEEDPIVSAQLLRARVDLDVDNASEGLESEAWVNTKLAHVNILDGLVTADLVRAFTYARTDVRSGITYTDPSTIVNLQIRGVSITDISPGANITLPSVLFGDGSYVTVYERIDHSMPPTEDYPFYVADVQVRMIHVYISNMPLLGEVEVIVSDSYAHVESPTPFCGIAQTVEAGAYTARVRNGLDDKGEERHGILVGEQHIGITGGSGHQQLLGEDLRLLGAQVLLNITETDVEGNIVAGVESESHARSRIVGLCVRLDDAVDECFIKVTVVEAFVHCYANATAGADCVGETTILELIVDGVDVCAALNLEGTCKPPAGTRHNVGPIAIYLNQQERYEEEGFESLYVRAIRIETPIAQIGTIIVGRAYASVAYEHAGTTNETNHWDL